MTKTTFARCHKSCGRKYLSQIICYQILRMINMLYRRKSSYSRLSQQNRGFWDVDIKKTIKNLLDKTHAWWRDTALCQHTSTVVECNRTTKNIILGILRGHIAEVHPSKNHFDWKDHEKNRIRSQISFMALQHQEGSATSQRLSQYSDVQKKARFALYNKIHIRLDTTLSVWHYKKKKKKKKKKKCMRISMYAF